MDPLTIGLGIVGLGLQLFGGHKASQEANHQAALSAQQAGISQQNFALENKVNDQRKQAMELSAGRQQLENYRNVQRTQAAGLSTAVSQGAQFGSGIQGGQAQATDQGEWNAAGISQNLQIGRNIFGLNDQINVNKSAMAGLQGQINQSQAAQATDQGLMSLGGAIVKNAGTVGNIFSFGQQQFKNNFGSYPGTYTSQNIP